ncbi:hypothetical protein OCI51_07425 [Lysinibacillus capsici]|uniref:hypothetical protein n=2 Tax=Lysinibacillus TaxID=400634 RepID=UPI0021DA9A48|nr:hypothetical protein [Lysinibacillus capsici]UYB48782.1 hypothetical protein OCI51_07425 [Lysinibacillus capsici]
MNKPYTIIFNLKGKAAVVIDKNVADDESKMIQRFIDDGYTIQDVSEEEYKSILKNGNFSPF